jgi:hypothetical protein
MTLPPGERRTVPRHLRDSEHDMSAKAPGSGQRAEDARRMNGGMRIWIYAAALAALVGMSLWLGLGAD